MYRKLLTCLFTLYVTALSGAHAGNMYLCGATLANSLAFVCRGRGYFWSTTGKRSGAYVSKRGLSNYRFRRNVHSPFLSEGEATDFLTTEDGPRVRVRRGIVEECCYKPCNFKHLESYCAPKKTTTRRTVTTTTTAAPTTTTTTQASPTPGQATPSDYDDANDVSEFAESNAGQHDNSDVLEQELHNINGSNSTGVIGINGVNNTLDNASDTMAVRPTPGVSRTGAAMIRTTRPTRITTPFGKITMNPRWYVDKKLKKLRKMRLKYKKKPRFPTKLYRFTTALPRSTKEMPFTNRILKKLREGVELN